MFETISTLPGQMRLIWIGDAQDGSGRRQIFSDTVSRCTWTSPTTWDASGRLLVRSALGQQAQADRPLTCGVISRDGEGCETLRSVSGHTLYLDGAGGVRIDTPDGMRDVPLVGVFFIHDPERTAGRRNASGLI
ncbi:hypothetical protein ACODT5_07550 [Streptomyces sp. 5.8]|uniref:hypothetical protein n=1 Tax=Streptomyces sp. 5.8 TaxID=3406571 RepID=UPI003BB69196